MSSLPFLGHEATYRSLDSLRSSGRLPHALIFLGPEGIGKQLVSRHLAKALLCEAPNAPCDSCHSCRLVAEGKHPDLRLIEGENGRIKIDTIRELKQELLLPPLVSKVRVVVMPEAHTLNAAAANALLKTLEEPPSATYFMLGSHAAGWVPRTILSRCQKIRCSPLNEGDLAEILRKLGKSPEPRILSLAQGSAHLALLLCEAGSELPALEQLWEGNDALGIAAAYNLGQTLNEGEKLLPFLEGLLLESHQYLTQGKEPKPKGFEVLTFAERILEFRRELRQNANPKLHLPRLLMFFQEPLESRL